MADVTIVAIKCSTCGRSVPSLTTPAGEIVGVGNTVSADTLRAPYLHTLCFPEEARKRGTPEYEAICATGFARVHFELSGSEA